METFKTQVNRHEKQPLDGLLVSPIIYAVQLVKSYSEQKTALQPNL